jgi:hypothetical protein
VSGATLRPGQTELETGRDHAQDISMTEPEEEPLMLPFQDKEGTGWHVVIRYHQGHERRVDGFATETEALEWILANSKQVDK